MYFLQNGVVSACPLGTCVGPSPNPITLAGGQNDPVAIATDGANVYWLNGISGEVMRCANRGCNQQPTVLASGIPGLARLTVDGASVYFTTGDKVMKVAK